MGIKLVEVEDDVARHVPECSSASHAMAIIEGAKLLRSRGLWSVYPRESSKFILRSVDDTPLLIVRKEMATIGIADAQPGEEVAWGEFKKPEVPFVPGSFTIDPLQFIAASMVRVALGNRAVEVTLCDDTQTFLEHDYPSTCTFEVGNPTVQFGFIPDEWIHKEEPINFSG